MTQLTSKNIAKTGKTYLAVMLVLSILMVVVMVIS